MATWSEKWLIHTVSFHSANLTARAWCTALSADSCDPLHGVLVRTRIHVYESRLSSTRSSKRREMIFFKIFELKCSYLNNSFEGEINGKFGESYVIIDESDLCFCFVFFLFFIRGKCRAQFGYLYVWLLTIADETRMLKQSRGCRRNRKFRGELAFNVSARAHLNGTLDK